MIFSVVQKCSKPNIGKHTGVFVCQLAQMLGEQSPEIRMLFICINSEQFMFDSGTNRRKNLCSSFFCLKLNSSYLAFVYLR